jgi:hypothetical protein
LTLQSKSASGKAPFDKRLLAQAIDSNRKTELAVALSSLIVRSPRSRNNIRITIEGVYESDGLTSIVDKTLIAANMHASHSIFSRIIDGGEKFVVLITDPTQPELMTLRLLENEVEFINRTIQIYSRDHIFFRSQKPTITDEFTQHEHLEFEYHEHPWLNALINSAITFQPMTKTKHQSS